MTTCPDCNRPLATAAQYRRVVEDGTLIDITRCWCDFIHDRFCDQLADDIARRAEADAAILADARCFPPGFLAAVAAALRGGAERHGVAPHETGGGQTREDHLRHAIDHLYGSAMGDDREPHLVNATARLALAWGREQAGK